MKQNRNTNNKKTSKVRVVPTIATQTFPSFAEAIANMRSVSTIIDSFFGTDIAVDSTSDEYTAFIAKIAADEYPQLLGKHNIHTSYHIAANRISVRGERDLQFGWNLNYTIVEGKAIVESVDCTIIMYNNFGSLKATLVCQGWSLAEKKHK